MNSNTVKVYICKNCRHTISEEFKSPKKLDKCPICGCDELEEFYAIGMEEAGAEPIWTTGDTVASQWDGLLQQQEIYPGQTNWATTTTSPDSGQTNWITTTTNSGTYVNMANWIK